MSTIRDVARLADVSISTVSNVINKNGNVAKSTEARVWSAIKALDYVPDYVRRSVRSGLTKTIGVIAEDIAVAFSGQMVRGICTYCEKAGYNVSLANMNLQKGSSRYSDFAYEELVKDNGFLHKLSTAVRSLQSSNVCGIIYIGDHPRDITPLIPHLLNPCVAVFSYTQSNSGCYCVNNDDREGAKLAVEHLIRNGHTRIGVIAGPTDSLAAHKRMIGYQETLMKYRIAFRPDYVYAGVNHWTQIDGVEGLKKLMMLPDPPTALFVMSDVMSTGVIRAAHELDLHIPEDLSIASFDDDMSAGLSCPPLTTVRTPFVDMGYKAAEGLVARLNTTVDCYSLLLPCQLIERETVASPRPDSRVLMARR